MVLRLILAAALAVSMASAQGGRKGGGGGGGGMGGDMGFRPQRQTRLDMIGDKLKLSKEQKDETGKIFDNAQEKTNPLNDQIRNGRGKITEMMIAGKTSGEEWDGLMKAFTTVLAQREAIETEAYQKVYTSLEDKQKKNAPAVFEQLISGMFESGNWHRPPMGAAGRGMGMGMGEGMGGGMGEEGMGTRGGR